MSMQIKAIILYSHYGETRVINFTIGKVNIITGKSDTGKSSLIQIVDYCLGQDSFEVSIGDNLNKVAWFAVLYQLKTIQVFVAKPPPKAGKKGNSVLYYKEGVEIIIPTLEELIINSNDDDLVTRLSDLIGIEPNKTNIIDGIFRKPYEANIKHSKFYLFQEQYTVADPTKLFYRQTDDGMALTIRESLPYFLGAVPKDYFRLEKEFDEASRELRLAVKRLTEAENITGNEVNIGTSLIEEAKQVGLIDEGFSVSNPQEVYDALSTAIKQNPSNINVVGDNRIAQLQQELIEAEDAFHLKHAQLKSAETYQKDINGYSSEVNEQVSRLETVNIFSSNSADHIDLCPLCSSQMNTPVPTTRAMKHSLEILQRDLRVVGRSRLRVDDYISKIKSEKEQYRQIITEKRLALQSLLSEEHQISQLVETSVRAAHVQGRISLYLQSLKLVDDISPLKTMKVNAERRVDKLKKELELFDKENQMTWILDQISNYMTNWAKDLNLGYKGIYRFNDNKLTVTVSTDTGMFELGRNMGGGSNWLGSHIILLLALHRCFIEKTRPVPSFLMLDQPTQVYFPDEKREKYDKMEGIQGELDENEWDVVNRLFNFFFTLCEQFFPNLQIIITDHANLDTEKFQDAMVEEPWRGGRALVPENWKSLS